MQLKHKTRFSALFGAALLALAGALTPQSAHAENITYPTDAGAVNVASYAGIDLADNGNDDTAAIQNAINAGIDQNKILYFANGTYNVSNTLVWRQNTGTGNWKAFMSFQGQSRAGVVFKLKDNCAGFGAGAGKPVIETAGIDSQGGNNAFSNSLQNFTLDVGAGNPGAVGISYQASNQGTLSDVTVRTSDAGSGQIGVTVKNNPGPALYKNLSVIGFDTGLWFGWQEYGFSLEHITLQNQRGQGIYNNGNALHIRDLQSTNSVQAINSDSNESYVLLVDGNLSGGAGGQNAINYRGTVLLRSVSVAGYAQVARQIDNGATLSGPSVAEWTSTAPFSLFPSTTKTLGLAVEETPAFNSATSQWVKVSDANADITQPLRDAIQAANDAGKDTVYLPHNGRDRLRISGQVRVWGTVRKIVGMGQTLRATSAIAGASGDSGVFKIESITGADVTFEDFVLDTESGASRYTWFEQNTSKPLILRSLLINAGSVYRNSVSGGKLFIEDVCGGGYNITGAQKVWARQLNCEVEPIVAVDDVAGPTYVLNNGGTMWVLGYKTERALTALTTRGGGKTEVLGGLMRPARTVPSSTPAFIVDGAQATFSYVTTAYNPSDDYTIQVRETRSGVTRDFGGASSSLTPKASGRGAGSAIALFSAVPVVTGPANVSGASLWLKANEGVTSDGSGNISFWTDQSGSGNNATASNGARPQTVTNVLNGQPVVRFNGSSNYLALPSGFADFTQGLSAFVVSKPTSAANWARYFDLSNGPASNNILFARPGTSNDLRYEVYNGGTTRGFSATGTHPINEAHLFEVVQAGGSAGQSSTATLWRDGTSVGTGTAFVPQNVTRTSNFIGKSNWNDALFQGDIAEVILYPRALSVSDRQAIETYLKGKYGLGVSPVGTGTGLRGEYFDNIDYTALVGTRPDATVDFDWGGGYPGEVGVTNGDTFSVRWTGEIEPRYSESYTFSGYADNGFRLWVDANQNGTFESGEQLVNQPNSQWQNFTSSTVSLTAGQKYKLKIEYAEEVGGAAVNFKWQSASQVVQIVPQTQLYPAAVPSSGPVNGAIYELEPQCAPGTRLDVSGAGDYDGANVGIWTQNGLSAQKWKFELQSDGSFALVPQCAITRRMETAGVNDGGSGANVDIWNDNGSDSRWSVTNVGGGWYELTPKHNSALRLNVENGGGSGSNVQLQTSNSASAQKWRLIDTNTQVALARTANRSATATSLSPASPRPTATPKPRSKSKPSGGRS